MNCRTGYATRRYDSSSGRKVTNLSPRHPVPLGTLPTRFEFFAYPVHPSSLGRPWLFVFAAWFVATGSSLGALFLGEVMGYTPCTLCWYQRIAMFPLPVILGIGLFPLDPRIGRYALPFSLSGLALAAYHVALVEGWIAEPITPCAKGIPCSEVQVVWLNFMHIPLLSLLAFIAITLLLLSATRAQSKLTP